MDASLRYAIEDSDLGLLLLAASTRGVCLIRFGRTQVELLEQLKRGYPREKIISARRELRPLMRSLQCTIAGRAPEQPLPLDIRGSRFQHCVWNMLCKIPAGETRSYRELAQALGMPGAARAVGRACAANPTPVLVPCHRVVRTDGSLGGYLGGRERKQWLLEHEQEHLDPGEET
ncbi:MAG: methylated-DNA--[protein]-cysteine S-methyltransferase [bacterium]|nr:methylated-DNA--[protein]-cysteine S-methyltransferase [bacterium]